MPMPRDATPLPPAPDAPPVARSGPQTGPRTGRPGGIFDDWAMI